MKDTRKYLRVNLSEEVIEEEIIPEEIINDFVGGRGLGIKYLYDELDKGVDPLGPENKLLLVTGPLAGTRTCASSRWIAVTKSPLSNTYTRSSGGGDFGAWLSFVGLDFILIEGRAEKPVYIYLEDNDYRIGDARGI